MDRIRENSLFGTGGSGVTTSHYRIEAEAPFNQVRVWIGNKNASGTLGNFKALIGISDTADITSIDNIYTPQQSGVVNNALVSSGVGWYAVTFAAASSLNMPNVAVAGNTAIYAASDWMNISSIPRSDVVGGRPIALMRLAQTGAGVYSQTTGEDSSYSAGRGLGLPWWREFIGHKENSDGVNTITNKPASLDPAGEYHLYAWLEFKYTVPVRSVISVGDSRMATAFSTYLLDNWPAVALRGLSSQSSPIGTCNIANSGATASDAYALLDSIIAQGSVKLTDAVLQGWSQNGFGQTDAAANAQIALMLSYIVKLRAMNVKIFMTTDYGLNGYSGAAEAARLKCVNQVKTWATAGLVTLVDTDSIITDYSGGAGIIKAAFGSGDNIHANATGQALMSALLASIWK